MIIGKSKKIVKKQSKKTKSEKTRSKKADKKLPIIINSLQLPRKKVTNCSNCSKFGHYQVI